jgi:hypothetical protein
LGNLTTPKSVQKLQMALHAKAKAEAGYRFYALYDKISREDILAHAYAQCRSVWAATMAWRTGACAQAGDLPTEPHQKSVHTEGQRQTQAAGHLDAPCIMHLVQFGLGDGAAIREELATQSRSR